MNIKMFLYLGMLVPTPALIVSCSQINNTISKPKIEKKEAFYDENTKNLTIVLTGKNLKANIDKWEFLTETTNEKLEKAFYNYDDKEEKAWFVINDYNYNHSNNKIKALFSDEKYEINIKVIKEEQVISISSSLASYDFNTKKTVIEVHGKNLPEKENEWEIHGDNRYLIKNFIVIENNSKYIKFEINNSIFHKEFIINIKNKPYINSKTTTNKINDPNVGFIDKDKYPEKFVDKHIFELNQIKEMKSVDQLIKETPLFKTSLNNFMFNLLNYDWGNGQKGFDFVHNITTNRQDMDKKFFELLKDVGIYGNYKINSDFDLIKFYTYAIEKEFMTEQKTLNLPSNETKANAKKETISNIDEINELIKQNIFGYLPSNLSQYFYYLKLDDIKRIFGFSKEIKEVYSEFDDELGKVNFYFEFSDKTIIEKSINKSIFTNLKKNIDYKQFIYDRSFIFETNLWKYDKVNPLVNIGYKFNDHKLAGSAWILDRIIDPDLQNKGKYEFLVGSNLHVFDLTHGFEKKSNYFNKDYVENWNGGFVSKVNAGDRWIYNDKIEKHIKENNKYYSYETLERTNQRVPVKFSKYDIHDVTELESQLDGNKTIKKSSILSSTIGSDNYLDLVWYTPDFKGDNIRAYNDSDSKYFFGDNYDKNYMGTTDAGGIDFAIAKIVLTLEEIKQLFPTLYNVINTPKEKEWYIGMGNDELTNANNTIIIGGFPELEWGSNKSIGGRIKTRDRLVSSPDNTQKYWTRYNEIENKRFNKYNGREEWYKKPFRDDLSHGMAIEKVLQNSVLYTKISSGEYLLGGASGSMAIDSKFNLVGVLYNGVFEPDNLASPFTNSIALLNSHSKFKNWEGSVKNDVIKKLKKENTKTIKLNSNV